MYFGFQGRHHISLSVCLSVCTALDAGSGRRALHQIRCGYGGLSVCLSVLHCSRSKFRTAGPPPLRQIRVGRCWSGLVWGRGSEMGWEGSRSGSRSGSRIGSRRGSRRRSRRGSGKRSRRRSSRGSGGIPGGPGRVQKGTQEGSRRGSRGSRRGSRRGCQERIL